jgi:hypothetical protein
VLRTRVVSEPRELIDRTLEWPRTDAVKVVLPADAC